ncbi:sensor domain-containing diguanylate cyclase [Comamonas composti]|uniref:sensor domain-containing diguanylate cyclase n=1 Tax=Comamonas composti TaxID=408558 RepID=UPI00047DDB6C|nr:sensor domain-containing diguanylate cyclase [Comamonas composti]
MKNKSILRMDLRRLIILLTMASAFVSLVNTFYATYSVQRQQLIDSVMQSNLVYSTKLAKSTNDFLKLARQQLSVSSSIIGDHFDDAGRLREEAERLKTQTDSFNSVVILDAQANVLASSPETLSLTGRKLSSPGVLEAMEQKEPMVSESYVSSIGNLLVFISHPIFSKSGEYLGAIGGTIYLNQESILNRLLGQHYHKDGSYLYVVDSHGKLIYHPDVKRVGSTVSGNAVIEKIAKGQSGSEVVRNSHGVEMVAGYAIVTATGWGVVAQRPMQITLAPLEALMWQVLSKTLPMALLSFVLIWWCAKQVARPLRMLADGAQTMGEPGAESRIQKIRSWYFESQELKKAMLLGVSLLHQRIRRLREDAETDPLTHLANRRGLEAALQSHQLSGLPFSVISIDIDHFKKVNDSHGHGAGDLVLRELARHMKAVSRVDDLPCRVGGEEFLVILPSTNKPAALQVAERLRQRVASADFEGVGQITISLGIASWPEDSEDMSAVLKRADEMLYRAKHGGRNRVES